MHHNKGRKHNNHTGCESKELGCHLSEVSHGSFEHGFLMPIITWALDKNVGVQKASAPVTKAMAVTPSEDHTKLRLRTKGEERKKKKKTVN